MYTPLFQAVIIQKISDIIDFNNWTLFSNIFNSNFGATGFNLNQCKNWNVLILYIVV